MCNQIAKYTLIGSVAPTRNPYFLIIDSPDITQAVRGLKFVRAVCFIPQTNINAICLYLFTLTSVTIPQAIQPMEFVNL